MRDRLLLVLFGALLTSCQTIPPKPIAGCSIAAYPLLEESAQHLLGGDQTFLDALERQRWARNKAEAPSRKKVLLLSGGSQHGSFGAGFFAGLSSIEDYDIVTGISTGAMQSAPVLLANRPVPPRDYPDYMRKNEILGAPGQSNLLDLALAYSIDREDRLIRKRPLGYLSLVTKASLATFAPIRELLRTLISTGTIEAIRKEADQGRKLYVGATNLEDGITYALDLTELSQTHGAEVARDCSVEAILASSTVPPGVAPVSLITHRVDRSGRPGRSKSHPYIDGGARYAVFFDQLSGPAKGSVPGQPEEPVDIDVLVNGALHLPIWTDAKTGRPRHTYSILDIASRSLQILESQARETSVTSAIHASKTGNFRLAYISNRNLQELKTEPMQHEFPLPVKDGGRTCEGWREFDRKTVRPLEFYPNYMRCLVDYGAKRGRLDPWNTK